MILSSGCPLRVEMSVDLERRTDVAVELEQGSRQNGDRGSGQDRDVPGDQIPSEQSGSLGNGAGERLDHYPAAGAVATGTLPLEGGLE